ncbi:hypothetical protein ACFV0H_13730 [Streptomyces erythrochromogenes]|uniref:DUF3885 domain-containing protein n=1 Tax=Streptomyces erythrochromogenes TaxID=285574 RepID=UPI001FD7BC91|nr:hypothetical protein [Streptomyces erythrochromogenes]MCX5584853.1 hypothetical protein [Streptomyces erythrochromogenes]
MSGPPIPDPDPAHERLTRLWQSHRPPGPLLPHELKRVHAHRWVRFHSLPESKRYAEDEAEYAILLDRYNTVLDELFAGGEAYVVTTDWADPSEPTNYSARRAALHPEGTLWTTLDDTDDPDPAFHTRWYFYADRRPWERGCLDPLLRAVADDALPGIFVTDPGLTRIHHPYDGGADVILPTGGERDRLREQHSAWLSAHPSGY